MAIVQGPLHSESASGQLAKSTIYQTKGRKTYVRAYAVPGNTPGHDKMNQSDAQLAHQAQFKAISDAWSAASDSDKASWATLASESKVTNYNAYTKENWTRVLSGRTITTVWPAVTTTTISYTVAGEINDPPTPDPSGIYEPIANINDMPAYYCAATGYYIYYSPDDETYYLADTTSLLTDNHRWWNEMGTLEGEFIASYGATGSLTVTLTN